MTAADPLSLVFSALADPTRRAILTRLSRGATTVGDLATPFAISAPAVSQHLKVLERAGLVERTARAQWRTVSLRTEPLDEVAQWVEKHRQEWNERFDLLDERLRRTKEDDRDD
ncbi:winged helix-turn-helix transcriptional regulator [Saccharopolyspora erythraea]|uniref:ArsR/SmtB family transcription factor n=1 Tax=Saccharopolyspora erythraea TaxID=1836 RepID=UPI001BABC395|nr:metalloregulator ArsR/SmtB family transcription factor [Saccharopolyspora erythraea]QUH05596.1 winged helix-turn-helix transcriptional regulator [Saccharopolyspora erythraea]